MVSNLGVCVIGLSGGIKPGQWLADEIKKLGGRISVRNADRLINGERKVTALALHVIDSKILADQSIRSKFARRV